MKEKTCARSILSGHKKRLFSLAFCALSLGAYLKYERLNRLDVERELDSVVAITMSDGRLIGSGAVLKGGMHVLTVNHVIQNFLRQKGVRKKDLPIIVRYRDGKEVRARLVKRNIHYDLALLELPFPHVRGLGIASGKDPRRGDKVYAMGHPFGISWMVTEGIISKKSYFPPGSAGNQFVLWTTAWIEGGSSGGPLVNIYGEIVGLSMLYISPRGIALGARHLNVCASGSEIRRFLEN